MFYLSDDVVLQPLGDVVVPPGLAVHHDQLAAVRVLLTLRQVTGVRGSLPLLPGQRGVQDLGRRQGARQVAAVAGGQGDEGVGGEQEGQEEVGQDGERNQDPLLLPAQSHDHHLARGGQRGRGRDGGRGRGRGHGGGGQGGGRSGARGGGDEGR